MIEEGFACPRHGAQVNSQRKDLLSQVMLDGEWAGVSHARI